MGRVRVVVAKPGADDHDRGAHVLARALRDAGIEVVYAGSRQTPEQIVATVVEEDADAVGLSVLSGDHRAVFGEVIGLLRARDAGEVVVFGGGIIPTDDLPALAAMGVAQVFGPGSPPRAITDWARTALAAAAIDERGDDGG